MGERLCTVLMSERLCTVLMSERLCTVLMSERFCVPRVQNWNILLLLLLLTYSLHGTVSLLRS